MRGIAPVIVLVALFAVGISMMTYAIYPTIDFGNWTIDVQNDINVTGNENINDDNASGLVFDNETDVDADTLDIAANATDGSSASNATNSTNSTASAGFVGGGSGGSSYTPPAEPEQGPVMIIRPECLDNYGLNATTVVFYYADEPHSAVMLPIVEELETNYTFFKTDDLWNKNAFRCFDLFGQTPAFVCAGSKAQMFGEVSKEVLAEFARNCS